MRLQLNDGVGFIFGIIISHLSWFHGVHASVHHGQWDHYFITQINLTNYNSFAYQINTTLDIMMIPTQQKILERKLSYCVLDTVKILWNTSTLHPTSIHLAFLIDNEWDGYSTSLSSLSSSHITGSNATPIMNPIRCELNEDHCAPLISNVHLLFEKKLLIEFDQPTNQPDLLTTAKLNVPDSPPQIF
jgi:hypothetical protein